MRGLIWLIERNVRAAWVIYGEIGIRQYYGYSKQQAKEKYLDECKKSVFYERRTAQ